MGFDTDEVLVGMNNKWNALGFKLGIVGGHCIGIDPYYLTNVTERLCNQSQIILNGRKVNDGMGAFVADVAIKQMIEAGLAPKSTIFLNTIKVNCLDTRGEIPIRSISNSVVQLLERR